MPPVQFINTEDDFLMIQASVFILANWRFYFLHLICAFSEKKPKKPTKRKKKKKKEHPRNTNYPELLFFWWVDSMEDYTYLLIAQFL